MSLFLYRMHTFFLLFLGSSKVFRGKSEDGGEGAIFRYSREASGVYERMPSAEKGGGIRKTVSIQVIINWKKMKKARIKKIFIRKSKKKLRYFLKNWKILFCKLKQTRFRSVFNKRLVSCHSGLVQSPFVMDFGQNMTSIPGKHVLNFN